jgi:hypothetical protein
MESDRHASSASSAGTYRNLAGKAHKAPGSRTWKLIASLEEAAPVRCRPRSGKDFDARTLENSYSVIRSEGGM